VTATACSSSTSSVQHRLERRRRHHDPVPERAAVRPADPGGLDERRGRGFAGYKVGDRVRTHTLYGAGVYVFNRNDPSIHTENGFEVPDAPASGCTTS
jgi:hypothetical protein